MESSRTHLNFSTFPSCKGRRPYAYTCRLLYDTSKTVAARSRCSVRSPGSDAITKEMIPITNLVTFMV